MSRKNMTEAEIRVAMTLLDKEGKDWVDAVRPGRFAMYCDCGLQGVFDTTEDLLTSNEYYGIRHSRRKHDYIIKKITEENILFLKEIALGGVITEEFFNCYGELYKAFEKFSDGKTSEEEILKELQKMGY